MKKMLRILRRKNAWLVSFYCKKSNEQRIIAGYCFVFGGLALLCKRLTPVLSRDAAFYLQTAAVWSRSGRYEEMLVQLPRAQAVLPFYIFLIRCLGDCGISPEVAGVGISMVVGSTLPLLVYLMAQEIQSDKRISLAASMLMAFNPSMIELACEIQRDMLYIGLCGWAVFFGLKGLLQKKLWPWIPAGLLGALSALTRYETFEMFPVLLMAFLIFGLKKVIPWKKICQQLVLFVVLVIVTSVGMVYLMGVQEHVASNYYDYLKWKLAGLERNIQSSGKK